MNVEFNTRDKKPNIRGIAILMAAAAAAVFLLIRIGDLKNAIWVNAIMTLYFTAVVAALFSAYRKQLEYNPYSYNTIMFFGLGLFLISLLCTFAYLTISDLQTPGEFSAKEMLFVLLNSRQNFLRLSIPFLVGFSILLVISNIRLIRTNRKSLSNLLAVILAFLIVAGLAAIFLMDHWVDTSHPDSIPLNLLVNLSAAVYLYFECMLIGTINANLLAAKYHPQPDKDFLIVLGAGLEADGTPSLVLSGRLDIAREFYLEQLNKTGKEAAFIVSGGQGDDEICSEAASMKAYLTARDIPEAAVYEENRSVNTAENMLYSKEIIDGLNPEGKVAFFTSDFHVFRAGLRARRVNMRAVGMGAPTRWYYWPNAAVREFIGLLAAHRMKQARVLAGMTAVYALLTILYLR